MRRRAPCAKLVTCGMPARPTAKGDAIDALRTPRDERPGSAWRRELRTTITWTLLAKGLGLILLWLLFFRGAAR